MGLFYGINVLMIVFGVNVVVVDVVLLIDVYVMIALFIRSDVVLGICDDDHDEEEEDDDDELVDLVES